MTDLFLIIFYKTWSLFNFGKISNHIHYVKLRNITQHCVIISKHYFMKIIILLKNKVKGQNIPNDKSYLYYVSLRNSYVNIA